MDEQTVIHQTINGRYRIKIERAASTKGIDGFTVEANGDDMAIVQSDAQMLYDQVKIMTAVFIPTEIK